MNLSNIAVAVLVVFILGVSLLNPGGARVAFGLALLVVAAVVLLRFGEEYILTVNKGKKARKKPDVGKQNQNDDGGRQE